MYSKVHANTLPFQNKHLNAFRQPVQASKLFELYSMLLDALPHGYPADP